MKKGVDYPGITTVFLCHDGNGNVFLAERSEKCRDEHHRWDCGGGSLDHGESLEDCLRREIKEEYNADIVKITFLGYRQVFRTNPEGEKTHWIAFDFLCEIVRDQTMVNEPEKFEDSGWFPFANLPEPLHSQFPTFLKNYETQLKKFFS